MLDDAGGARPADSPARVFAVPAVALPPGPLVLPAPSTPVPGPSARLPAPLPARSLSLPRAAPLGPAVAPPSGPSGLPAPFAPVPGLSARPSGSSPVRGLSCAPAAPLGPAVPGLEGPVLRTRLAEPLLGPAPGFPVAFPPAPPEMSRVDSAAASVPGLSPPSVAPVTPPQIPSERPAPQLRSARAPAAPSVPSAPSVGAGVRSSSRTSFAFARRDDAPSLPVGSGAPAPFLSPVGGVLPPEVGGHPWDDGAELGSLGASPPALLPALPSRAVSSPAEAAPVSAGAAAESEEDKVVPARGRCAHQSEASGRASGPAPALAPAPAAARTAIQAVVIEDDNDDDADDNDNNDDGSRLGACRGPRGSSPPPGAVRAAARTPEQFSMGTRCATIARLRSSCRRRGSLRRGSRAPVGLPLPCVVVALVLLLLEVRPDAVPLCGCPRASRCRRRTLVGRRRRRVSSSAAIGRSRRRMATPPFPCFRCIARWQKDPIVPCEDPQSPGTCTECRHDRKSCELEAMRAHLDFLRSRASLTAIVWPPDPGSGKDVEQELPAGGGVDGDGDGDGV